MSTFRSFLFLQGGCSPLFARLSDRLRAEGHAVYRINFNAGDRLYWGRRMAASFRGKLDELPAYYEEKMAAWDVSDVVLFNDRRPVHLPAIPVAKARGIRIHVFEEGYFRPYYLTLERDGVNGNSALPRDPAWYRETGKDLPDRDNGQAFPTGLLARAAHDVAYEIANLANPVFFPQYRTHVPYNRWLGYAAHARRFAAFPLYARRDRNLLGHLKRAEAPFYFLPLQLESDAQIRHHSPFSKMSEILSLVMRSFARNAPPESRLVIKNHPLDPGFQNYGRMIARLAKEMDIARRVDYVDTGDASALVPRARGVVTVNSTVGMSSLAQGRPTIVLGTAIYNLPGLAFQGPLDVFWRDAEFPDRELFRRFRNTVIHATQVNGGFYTDGGVALAAANSVARLLAERSPLKELLCLHARS
jgi:capsular polysaccharide export protein